MANILEFIIRAKDEASKQLSGINVSLGGVMETALGFSLANVGGMVADEMREMVSTAAELEGVQGAFRNLAEDAGKNADQFIAELKEMSGGLMTEGEIMKMTNQAILLGGKELADKLPMFMKVSQAAARATGQSFDYMFNSIITGTARGSKLILDNLGIMVDWQKAYDGYAESLGKTARELSEAEKAQARYNEVGRAAEEHLARLGTQEETTAEKMKQIGTAVAEAKTEIGKLILMGLDPLAEGFLWLKGDIEEASAAIDPGFVQDMEGLNIRLGQAGKEIYENRRRVREWKEEVGWAVDVTELWEERLGDLASDALPEVEKGLIVTGKEIQEFLDLKEEFSKPLPEAPWLESLRAYTDVDEGIRVALQRTTDARILAAQQALVAEENSYEGALAAAMTYEEGTKAAWEDAKTRLDETRAGLHGVAGAYDELAIVAEDVEPFKALYEDAKKNRQLVEEEWAALGPTLESNLTTAIAQTSDPVLKGWQDLQTNMAKAQQIANEAMITDMAETFPTMETILAQYVQDYKIEIADLPMEFRGAVWDIIREQENIGTELAAQAMGWLTTTEETTGGMKDDFTSIDKHLATLETTMSDKLGAGLVDPMKDAIDSAKDYRVELDKLDGTHVHVYIHEHTIEEGGGSHDDYEP